MSHKSDIGTDLEAMLCNELNRCRQQRPISDLLLYNEVEAMVTSLSSHSMLVDMTPHYSYLPMSVSYPRVQWSIVSLLFSDLKSIHCVESHLNYRAKYLDQQNCLAKVIRWEVILDYLSNFGKCNQKYGN